VLKLPSFSYVLDAFLAACRRFPLPMLAAFIGTFAVMNLIEMDYRQDHSGFVKILMTASLALPSFLAAAILSEKRGWIATRWLPSAVVLGLLAVYLGTLQFNGDEPGMNTVIRFLGLNLAAHLLVACLPFFDETPLEDFWEYNRLLLTNFIVGAVYSLVIFAGLGIAILAVNELFDLHIQDQVYGHLFAIVAGIVNTSFFLSNFPRQYENLASGSASYSLVNRNLTKYILIPITAIYFLILYAYSAKILFTWELPRGWVGKLVLGFSIAGMLTYLLNYLLVKYDDSSLIRGFRRWFFYVLLPMVGLLFVAVGRRIGDYGVTEERYVVATAGVWLLMVCLYFIFSRKDDIRFIPASLAVVAILTVLGPLSAFKVSERSQIGRLKSLLEKNGMFADGKVVPAKDSLETGDGERIRDLLYYLYEHEHFQAVAGWFPGKISSGKPDWTEINELINGLKIKGLPVADTYCNYYFDLLKTPLSIAGYEQLWNLNSNYMENDMTGWVFLENGTSIRFYEKGEVKAIFDLKEKLKTLAEKYGCNPPNPAPEDAETRFSDDRYEVKLVLENLNFSRQDSYKINNLNAKVLMKQKK
jgi:hypothetical protein